MTPRRHRAQPGRDGATVRLLITGSRDATPRMLSTARHAVERAKANGWEIVVGDASGVDAAVVRACTEFEVFGDCYGIADEPRCGYSEYLNYIQVTETIIYRGHTGIIRPGADYLERDRRMVQKCNRVLAIWNGQSRGTRYTFEYAQKHGKHVDVMTFEVSR